MALLLGELGPAEGTGVRAPSPSEELTDAPNRDEDAEEFIVPVLEGGFEVDADRARDEGRPPAPALLGAAIVCAGKGV